MNSERGFTILEIMICLAILSGVVVTILGSLNYHLGLVAYNRDFVTASILAKEKAQEAVLFGVPKIREGSFAEPMNSFQWKITADKTDFEGVRRLGVNISWGMDNRVSFISYLLEKQN